MPPRKEEENRPIIGTGSPAADRFLNEPFLPKIGGTLTAMFTPQAGSPPPMPAGVAAIPQGASAPNLNPVPFLQSLNPLANTPLIGGLAQGRGQRQEITTPTVPTLPSGTPRVGFDVYPTMPQSVASMNPRVATAEDIAAFRAANFNRPAQPVAATPQPTTPVAPTTPERIGVQTAYGMVYPTRGQEAAAQRLAQMPRMGARLAAIGEQLTQEDRLARARQGGGEIAQRISRANEDYFASQRKEPQPQQKTAFTPRINPVLQQPMQASAPAAPQQRNVTQPRVNPIPMQANLGGQTTQRSWSNYTGPNPIRNFNYNNMAPSFYGFSQSGQPMTRIPTASGNVVYDEESGRYIPV